MNIFDAVVTAAAILAMVLGFRAGLLRSLATILGYLAAAPVAVAITPRVITAAFNQPTLPPAQAGIVLLGVLVVIGAVVSVLFRAVVAEFAGPHPGLFDQLAGAVLGLVRIFLVAVLIVLIFDRIIPRDSEPQFLAGSKLRPYLSAAGQRGLQTLPPEVADYIDGLKRERGL